MKYSTFIQECRKKNYDGLSIHVHHIVPRSEGGTDEPENLIALSVHDHFWAHVWYAKEFNRCKTAPNMLLHNYKTRADFTEMEWDEAYLIATQLMRGNKNMLGKSHTKESKELNRIKHLGNKHTDEIVKVIGVASKAMWNKRKSDPTYKSWSAGRKWYNDGTKSIMAFEQPDGFVTGRLNGSDITKKGHKNRKKINENTNDFTSKSD